MYASAELFVVPSDQVDAAWPVLAPIVSRVTDMPWSLDDIRIELLEKRAQAWGVRHDGNVVAVVMTRIENTPTHRYGVVWLAAGTALQDGLQMFREHIEPWMFGEQGCEWVELMGRRGWVKTLPDYETQAVVMRKFRQVH